MKITLDPDQKRAVEYDGGPLLVVAGPGSGKTRVLTERVRHLVKQGKAKPEEILCLTFTDKASSEMSRRLEEHGMDVSNMDIGTFHSFGRKVLSDNELETGLDIHGGVLEKTEAIVWAINHIDDFGLQSVKVGNNALTIMRSIMDGISSFAKALYTADNIDEYVTEKADGADEEEKESLLALADLSKVYHAYEKFKRSMHVIDYDDMVSEAIRLFKAKSSICRRYQNKYKHILVDELQDNNYAQFKLVRMLTKGGNITGVGDGDQSIYSFQGAYRGIFDEFRDAFEGTEVVNLPTNYRSTENIVRLTNDWMKDKAGAFSKRLESASGVDGEKIVVVKCDTDLGEAEYVAKKIAEIEGLPYERQAGGKKGNYKEVAILTRRKIDGDKFEVALAERGIPVKYIGSTDLLYTPIVRDLMAHIKIAAEPSVSGAEITQLMKMHGITEKNIARINREAKRSMYKDKEAGGGGGDYVLVTIKGEDGYRRPRTTQEGELCELEDKIDKLTDIGRGAMPIDQAIHKIMMSVSGLYKKAIQDNSKHGKTQQWRLNEIYRIASEHAKLYKKSTLTDFIKYMYQMGEQEGESRDSLDAENAVEITTIHQSKGREFRVVFVVDASKNKLPVTYRPKKFDVPDNMSKDRGKSGVEKKVMHKNEERRLLYVAMTRAKDKLFITFPEKYKENVKESKPSDFLVEDELDYANNTLVVSETYAGGGGGVPAEKPGVIERLTRDKQEQAITAIGGLNLNTAVRRIVELSKIKYFEKHQKLDGFSAEAVLDTGGGGGKADMDRELEGSKEKLVDSDSFEFTASMIEAYERCPLLFNFRYVLEVPHQASNAMYKGIVVHGVLEKIGERRMRGEETSEEQAAELLEMHWEDERFDSKKISGEYKKGASEMILAVVRRDKSVEGNTTIVAVEKKFKVKLDDGLTFFGQIDRIDRMSDGSYTVIDYKTGRPKDIKKIAENIQMNMYAIGTESIYNEIPAKAMQLYVPDLKEVGFKVNAEQVDKQRERIGELAKAALRGEFSPTPSAKACNGCSYLDICDHRHPGSEKRR